MPDKTEMGDRLKRYEFAETSRRLMPRLPAMARMDGVCFSRFTKGLKRPYDEELSRIMIELTKFLVEQTNACIGYTQSDEISLVMHTDNIKSQIYNDGKIVKMVGKLAAITSVRFNKLCNESPYMKAHLAKKGEPYFDARVWNVPDMQEAANSILWRELDATKNSVSMATRSVYSHKQLMHKHTGEMQEMLFQKGINWNDYPDFFKRGTFIQRRKVIKELPPETLVKIPEHLRPLPGATCERSVFEEIKMPVFTKVINRTGVIFKGEEPKVGLVPQGV